MLVRSATGRVVLGVGMVVCLATTALAAAIIWLLLTEPMVMVSAVDSGDTGRIARSLLGVVITVFRALVGYL